MMKMGPGLILPLAGQGVHGACSTRTAGPARTPDSARDRAFFAWHARCASSGMTALPRATHVRRYAEIASLLVKYGRSDVVKAAGLHRDLGPLHALTPRSGATPDDLVHDLERMGPTFVKIGQMLSTRPDLLPAPHVEALAKLQDKVEPVPFEEIERIVSEELCAGVATVFAAFDVEPIASASLGQVHRAVLHDGREVAVKVQRPGVRERVTLDLEVLDEVAAMVDAHTDFGRRWATRDIVGQFRDMLLRELDYRLEARNLVTLGRNLAEFDLLVVPQPHGAYTSPRVLTMDHVHGWKITDVGPLSHVDVDGEAIADQLFRAYLKQILVDGFLHADPHPGNVFLTRDRRLALLDLGMVARVPQEEREQLLKLVVAVSKGEGEHAADVAAQIGKPLPWFDRAGFRRDVAELVTWNEGLALHEVEVGRVVMEIATLSGRNGLRVPPDLALVGKALLSLDKIGRTLDPDFDPNAAVREHAAELVTRRMKADMSLVGILPSLFDARQLLEGLPGNANRILKSLADHEFKVTVEAIDEDRLISGLQKIANRITLGLVLASLVVGAALLMRVETSFRR